MHLHAGRKFTGGASAMMHRTPPRMRGTTLKASEFCISASRVQRSALGSGILVNHGQLGPRLTSTHVSTRLQDTDTGNQLVGQSMPFTTQVTSPEDMII